MNNLELFKIRARNANNDRQHNRMVTDKLKSLHRAELYSYQAAWIKKDFEDGAEWVRALINPDRVKFDYDEKTVSIDFEYGFSTGNSFEWPMNSGIHWLILKQELTELAYFHGNIRRCLLINAVDPDTKEEVPVWAAIRGPVETRLEYIERKGITADVPNLSLDIYMPLNEENLKLFDRYKRFQFAGRYWQVGAIDNISTPNILEVVATENYECHGDELLFDVQPTIPDSPIIGESLIKPLSVNLYTAPSNSGSWSITLPDQKRKLEQVIEWNVQDDGTLEVKWIEAKSGTFEIHYGDMTKLVVVQSLF